ncbi:hypothetical protein JW711_05235 [Candidatus Woesearchaeota archaeon]|nr:hypothetical protein [Candidatus Woesearchaeota archaeon]
MRKIGNNLLAVVLVLSIIYSLSLSMWTYNSLEEIQRSGMPVQFTGKAYGMVDMCINSAPNFTAGSCAFTMGGSNYEITLNQEVPYNCSVIGSDADGNTITFAAYAILINRTFSNDTSLPLQMLSNGTIIFNTTSENVGIYIIQLRATDNSGCSNSVFTRLLSLNISNQNDPPYLVQNISDITFNEGETVHALYLNNYFADPDNDPLNYTVAGNSTITITILPTSEVILSSTSCGGTDYVMFTAMDPYNLTADSNLVAISCVLSEPPQNTGGEGDDSGSGGGGGSYVCPPPEYECYTYHKCNVSNQKLVRCIDIHGCERDHFLTMACQYEAPVECNESWVCSEWSSCTPFGIQTRSCVDINGCGTNYSIPIMTRECEYVGNCSDGIKNCHDNACEEGVDCGGPCEPCQSVQVPYPFPEEKGIGVYILTGFLLLLLTGSLGYHYFRKEINQTLAKFGWFLMRKRRKQYLLSKEDQKKLMAEIMPLQNKLDKQSLSVPLYEVLNKYDELLRYYLSRVVKINPEFDEEMLNAKIEKSKRKLIPALREVFKSMFTDYKRVSGDKDRITRVNVMLLFEELRNMILQTSEVTVGEYPRDIQEYKEKEDRPILEKVTYSILNTYIALEFVEIEVAKRKYLEIIKEYDKMTIEEEEEAFQMIQRLYNNVSYVNGWAWTVKKR